jgi:hypothetical protein
MSDEIKVGVGVDGTNFSTGLEKLKEQSAQFGENLDEHLGGISQLFTPAAAGAAALAVGMEKVGEAVSEASEKAEKIQNLAERFGASATAIQRLTNAAEQNGATFEDVSGAYNKLEINSQKAIEGNTELVAAFADIGVSVDQLKNMSPDELMNAVADGTANATDKGAAYNDVVNILGKSAGNLFDTMNLGSKQIAAVGDASGVMSDDTVAALDDMHKTSTRFWGEFVALAGTGFVNLYRGLGSLVIVFTEEFKAMENVALAFWQLLKDVLTHPFDTGNFTKFKDSFVNAIASAVVEGKARLTELVNPPKKPEEDAGVRKARAGLDDKDKKGDESEKKDESEAARLNEDAQKRDAERAEKAKSLEQQIADVKLSIAKETEFSKNILLTDLGRAQARDAIAIEQDKLAELEKLQKEANEKAKKEALDLAIDKQKDAVQAAEALVKKDEDAIKTGKGSNPAVDDLRRIGGGSRFSRGGMNNSVETAAKASLVLNKQAVEIAKLQLEQLTKLNRPNMPSGNGAYSL